MAPLLVGDYVTVSGTEIDGTLWVNNLEANLGIYTFPGSKPAYVTVEEAIYGVNFAPNDPNVALGEIAETRAVAWTTDVGGGLLDWFAMDQDPCTGIITERSTGGTTTTTVFVSMQPNTATAPLGRAVFRTQGKPDLTPATRSIGFRMRNGTTIGAGGIIAGQFVQPIFDYIMPELLAAGTAELVNPFDVIPYLAKGSGPYVPGILGTAAGDSNVIVGQLSPWPGASTPPTTVCGPPTTPTTPTPTPTPTSTTPAGPADTIVITSAVGVNKKGSATLTVAATTTSFDPLTVLSISATGQNPVTITAMTLDKLGSAGVPSKWSFVVTVKNKPLTVTVSSNVPGNKAVTANVA